jgi:membrane-associated phospholipid phosphatase
MLYLTGAIFGWMCLATGCGTLAHGRGWGQDAFVHVNAQTTVHAVQNALFDVQTLLPAAGAIVFAAGGLDHRASDWATEHTPLFGSQETARNVSGYLRGTLLAETFVTMLATPSGNDAKEWLPAKGKGVGVELLALGATAGTTEVFKRPANRTRPDGSSNGSLPSNHASMAFSAATLTNRNVESLHLTPRARYPLQAANILLASGTAWARVEGAKHFPSDVLAGAALGRFLSVVIHDACIGLPAAQRLQLNLWPSREGVQAQVSFFFD